MKSLENFNQSNQISLPLLKEPKIIITPSKEEGIRTEKTDILTTNHLTSTTKRSSFHHSLQKSGFQKLKAAQKIADENDKLAKKLLRAWFSYYFSSVYSLKFSRTPIVSRQALEKDFKIHSEIANKILKYHILKPKPEAEWGNRRRHGSILNEDEESKDAGFGLMNKEEIEELYRQHIYLNLELNSLVFTQKGHEPDPKNPTEKYFMEVKACYKGMRRTIPEDYKDFAKSVMNEFFNMAELVSFFKKVRSFNGFL